ncbi:hypothetical protein SAMN05216238_10739 [Lentibacillus persicus]|uniref:PRC-barrel domain-containing protein n=1 Tax=Lentibacillus persicus TaxID=640948 RepID=A0A1I1WZD5_9BACI|nr:PRC-barrel domain-containing protein [Lentibacillus persicus]SFE00545.1 hypothetical protein SAMN05216238_10739 [Lentibacillus persicus]
MLYFTSDLNTYHIEASDGQMGKVQDLYFDDEKWVVRYAVLDVRKWLPTRRILLSPASFTSIDTENQQINVKHDKETVRNSPSIPADATFSSDLEMALTGYYGWSRYWLGGLLWGVEDMPGVNIDDRELEAQEMSNEPQHNLRSEQETGTFRVHANDGKIGEVSDIIIDDIYWKVRCVVVSEARLPAEDKFMPVNAEQIQSVDWLEGDIYINSDLEDLNNRTRYESKEALLKAL